MERPEADRPSAPYVVIDGRVLGPSTYRPSTVLDLGATPEWKRALAVLGALLVGEGATLLVNAEWAAIGGVALFLVAAVAAGSERLELATSLGTAGLCWVGGGVAATFGNVGSAGIDGLLVAGALVLAFAWFGVDASGRRTKRISPPAE